MGNPLRSILICMKDPSGDPPTLQSQRLLQDLLQNSYHAITALEAIRNEAGEITDFLYIFASRKALKLLRKSSEELIGHRILEVFPGVIDQNLFESYVEVVETGKEFNKDHPYQGDGLNAHFQVNVTPFRDGIMISFIETTEQVLQARKLQILSERLRLATSAAKVGVWDYDFESNQLIWDSEMHRIHGVPPREFGGTFADWEKCVHPDDLPAANGALQKAMEDGSQNVFNVKYRILHPSDGIRWIEARAVICYDDKGGVTRMTGTNWDITDHVNAHEKLARAKSHAEKANLAKSEFLAMMSHELRTPLSPIMGCTDLLLERAVDEDQRQMLSMIGNCGRDLLAIITDILDYCSLTEGRLSLDKKVCNLPSVTRTLCEEFRASALDKGILLHFDGAPDFPKQILMDPQRYQQILRNLLSNAVKFTESGFVTVTLKLQTSPKPMVQLEVGDTGIGIPEEKLETIFNRFSQVDSGYTRKHGGTGLGLAICRQLSELMNGDIHVESQEGEGSTFTVRLEIQIPCIGETQPTEGIAGSPDTQANAHVLIIDDDKSNLSYLTQVLEHFGLGVTAESDPFKGKHLAMGRPFDIILLDLHMPGLDGWDLAVQIRENSEPNGNKPIMAVTADVLSGEDPSRHPSDFDRVITKPVQPQRLRKAVSELLQAARN